MYGYEDFSEQKAEAIASVLASIGYTYIDSFMNFQQREFLEEKAIEKYNKRDKQIKQLLQDTPNPEKDPILSKLIEMHKEHPSVAYNRMKTMLTETASEALYRLDLVNSSNGINYTINDCVEEVYRHTPKEFLIQEFKRSESEMGIYDIVPNLLDSAEMKRFERLATGMKEEISSMRYNAWDDKDYQEARTSKSRRKPSFDFER